MTREYPSPQKERNARRNEEQYTDQVVSVANRYVFMPRGTPLLQVELVLATVAVSTSA